MPRDSLPNPPAPQSQDPPSRSIRDMGEIPRASWEGDYGMNFPNSRKVFVAGRHGIRVALRRDQLRECIEKQLGKDLSFGRRDEERIKPVAAAVEVGKIAQQTVDDPFGHDDEIGPARPQGLAQTLG